jgi:hypothetical protein
MADPAYKAINPALIFNLSMEPAIVFNLATFADKGADEQIVTGRTSYKLQDNVLYLESATARYEISRVQLRNGFEQAGGNMPKYRLAQVRSPLLKDN